MKILIAGGGTAGHVFPALALAQRLRERDVEACFVGTERGFERDLVPAAGFEITLLDVRQFPRRLSIDLVRAPAAVLGAVRRCRPLVRGADVVVGMGGYASAPAVIAAWLARRPVVLHEQNAIPGAANRYLSRLARVVGVSFAGSAEAFPRSVRTRMIGNPVRSEVVAVARGRVALRSEGIAELRLDPDRRTILVFGGSQGAARVNEAVAAMCASFAGRDDLQILWVTGRARAGVAPDAARSPMVRELPFVDRMELAYAAADLVVCRAGATSIAELTVCGLPALLIPYPHATADHQTANARELEREGAAEVIADAALSPDVLTAHVARLIDEPERLASMAARSASLGHPEAADSLADLVQAEAIR